MTGILQSLLGSVSSAAASATDAFFNLVTLLLPGNGTNGAQNNTFLDSSTNNFTITRNGNTTQGTFSPFSQTGWGNYFDGSSYLSIANNANLNLGSSNFTIEFWIYAPSATNPYGIISKGNAASIGSESWSVEWTNTTGTLGYGSGAFNGWASPIVTGTVTLNAWNHVAVVRNGTTHTLYINGTSASTATASYTVTSSGSLYIGTGWYAPSSRYMVGYVSNARVVIGTAVYTSNFTPSTTPLTAITNTQLLTCQSNRFVDNSTNAFAITTSGTPSVQAFSPFAPTAAYDAATNGGSGYYDGAGDYLLNTTSNLQVGSSTNFTLEFWLYRLADSTADQGACIFAIGNESASRMQFTIYGSAARMELYGGSLDFSGGTVPQRAWTHVAYVRSGSTVTIYVNGSSVATATYSGVVGNVNGFISGANRSITSYYTGYVAGLRLLNGTAQYTSNFTPPTSPPTAITNTSFLLNYTNAGIVDSTAKNVLETVSNVQVSTTQSKFGGSSMWFQAGGTLAMANSPNLSFGTGDFTVEWWVYWNTVPSASVGFVSGSGTGSTDIRYDGTNLRLGRFLVAFDSTFAWTAATGQWYHVAVTRQGTSVRAFVNGTQIGTTSTNSNTYNAVGNFYIGTVTFGTPGDTPLAYIDDFRITKGYARYTANFTAPTAAFALQ